MGMASTETIAEALERPEIVDPETLSQKLQAESVRFFVQAELSGGRTDAREALRRALAREEHSTGEEPGTPFMQRPELIRHLRGNGVLSAEEMSAVSAALKQEASRVRMQCQGTLSQTAGTPDSSVALPS